MLQCKLHRSSQVQTPNDDLLSDFCYLKAESDSSTVLFPGQCRQSGPSVKVVPVEISHGFVTVNLKIILPFAIHKRREKITKYLHIFNFPFGIMLLAQTSARSTLSA